MITLSVLTIIVALIVGAIITFASFGSVMFILIFGDAAVCIAIIGLVVYLFTNKNKKDKK